MATALITGANRGIGLELCRQLSGRGDKVIAAVRSTTAELASIPSVVVREGVDVTSESGVGELAEALAGQQIDLLINNAGVLSSESLQDLDFDRMRWQFEVNTLGPLRVTHALLDNLTEGSKVLIVTSRMGSIADNTSGSRYGYRISKAGVNMAGVSLARDLAPRGVAVGLLHPGFVRTKLTGGNGLVDPPESARGLIDRIDGLSMENTGSFWHAKGEALPW